MSRDFLTFDVDLDNFIDDLNQILEHNQRAIEELLLLEDKSYASFIKPFEMLSLRATEFFTPLSHQNSVNNSDRTQEVYAKALSIITEYSTQVSQNVQIYRAYRQIKADQYNSLDTACKRVLDLGIEEFELSGAHLDQKSKETLAKINLRVSELSNDFSQNLLDATADFEYLITDERDVVGIPASDLEPLKCKDGWKFTLQMPSYIAYMTYGSNSKIRQDLYRAYVTRAPQNALIIDELLALRDEMATLLGFEDYASYSLASKMAKDSKSVLKFLDELLLSAKDKASLELKELQLMSKADLVSSDIAYYSQRLKEQEYEIDESAYRVYFELQSVLNGMFDALHRLFGIRAIELNDVIDEHTRTFEIYLGKNLKARLYLDLEARSSKRGGAWMHNFETNCTDEDGKKLRASAFVVCNFAPSTDTTPSLLRHDDVVTLFHEMGHALHHILSEVDEYSVSGVNGVEWDAVEFPSQFLENFAYEPAILKLFAFNYKSGEVLSDEMIEKLRRAKNFQSASALLRQIEFAMFDMKLHTKENRLTTQELLDQIRKETSLIKPPSYNKFQNGFAHIFAGGYAAGYYSYKYAELLSADAYMAIIEQGIFDTQIGKKYLDIILKKGGSSSMRVLFKELLGRECDSSALLRFDGIV